MVRSKISKFNNIYNKIIKLDAYEAVQIELNVIYL